MDLKTLEKFFLQRQSCRDFAETPLSHETVEGICRAALLAPSAVNAQPWKLLVPEGEKFKEVIDLITAEGRRPFVKRAQAIVVVCEDVRGRTFNFGGNHVPNPYIENDIGILTAHLILAAKAAGVGSCILGWKNETALHPLLGIPQDVLIPELVALGYPAENTIREKRRKPLSEGLSFLR